MTHAHVPSTIGALLLGGLFSTILSGGVSAQCILYFNSYPDDKRPIKVLAVFVWLVDLLQTVFIWAGLWYYLIEHFGDRPAINSTPWPVASITVSSTALTVAVHGFYAYRIYILGKRHWLLPSFIGFLCLVRAGFAGAVTSAFVIYPTYSSFRAHLGWIFTVALSLLFGTDVIVTASLIYLLYKSRTATTSPVNNTLTWLGQYTLKTGIVNCAGALSSLICWCTMSHNLIFLTIFWAIAKLYANSFFAALNARESLRRRSSLVLSESDPLREIRLGTRTSDSMKFARPRSITKSASVPQLSNPRSSQSTTSSSISGATSSIDSNNDRSKLLLS